MVKYAFDRVMAAIGLVVLSPVLLVIWIIQKVREPHLPAIFRQQRVGLHGKLFTIYKFRTMTDVEEHESSVTVSSDSRITPMGRVMRRLKLDELPELWNVLKGDMSFVGPRPDVPGYADQLKGEDRYLLELRPGITGPATMKYRNEDDILCLQADPQAFNDRVIYPDKVRINIYYLRHYNFFKDIQMLVCTVLNMRMRYNGEYI